MENHTSPPPATPEVPETSPTTTATPPDKSRSQGISKDAKLDQDKQKLAQSLDELAGEIVVADEWGIFGNAQPPAIYVALDLAYETLAVGKPEQAQAAILNVQAALNQAQNASWSWQIQNRFGLPSILLVALSTLVTYDLIFWPKFWFDWTKVIEHATFAGMVGAVLRSLYWLQFQAGRGVFRPRWFVSLLVAPPIGIMLGWLVSLLINAAAQAVNKGTVNADWRTICLLAAFAGYNWEWTLEWLEEAANSIRSRIKEKAVAK
jgi:hypothetical protein